MCGLLLEIYFGDKLVEQSVSNNFLEVITQSTLFYFFLIFSFFFICFILLFFIIPLFKKNPEQLYKKYLVIRKEMKEIDKLNEEKKISFDDYVYAQFNYAKEYSYIISILSKYPEYKDKLKSYKIQENTSQIVSKSEINKEDTEKIDMLYNLLAPQAKYYNTAEIKTAILDEGFNNFIANKVIEKLRLSGVKFGSEVKYDSGKLADFLNTLFKSKMKDVNLDKKYDSVNINDLIKQSKEEQLRFKQNAIDYQDRPIDIKVNDPAKFNVNKEEKGGILQAFKKLFLHKEKEHTINEINNIFADIEKSINKK